MSSPAPDFEIGTDGPSLILVGVDGSRTSLRAAAYAAGLARRQGCRILAVYVSRVPAGAAMAPGSTAAMNETFDLVADDLERLMMSRTAVMLEEEAVRGIRVDLHGGIREQARDEMGVARRDHRVAVAVGHEDRLGDGGQSLQRGVVRVAPGADRVVLRFAGRISAISWATKLPMENPRMSALVIPMAVMNAIASWTICSMVEGVVPVEPPTPALSNATSRPGSSARGRRAIRMLTASVPASSRSPRAQEPEVWEDYVAA